MYLTTVAISLLGGSQTFLGVMTTIVLLCIFADKNNFILRILRESKSQITKYIYSLGQETRQETLTSSSEWKLLHLFIKDKNNETHMSALYKEGIELSGKIIEGIEDVKYSNITIPSDVKNGLKIVDTSKEQLLSPLYTFLFCLTVFIYDEILRSPYVQHKDILISSLSIFILVSWIFWFFVWWVFWKRTSIKYISQPKDGYPTETKANIIKEYAPQIISYPLIFILSIFLSIYYYQTAFQMSLIATLIMAIGIPAYKMMKSHIKDETYKYSMVFRHYYFAILAGVFISMLLFLLIRHIPNMALGLSTYSGVLMKSSILIFVLLNGLILPFAFPYYSYYRYKRFSKKKDKESKKTVDESINELMHRLSDFVKQIPSPTTLPPTPIKPKLTSKIDNLNRIKPIGGIIKPLDLHNSEEQKKI